LIRTELDTLLRRYRRINPAMVLAVDADRMPPPADLVDHLEFALRRVEEALASEDRLETLEQLRDAGAAIEDALIAARLGRRVSR
jgi:hypothetical protein